MDSNVVTLLVSLAGIIATLIASGLGLYFTARARSAPLRELLYSKQIELISKIIYKQGRFLVYATILADDDPKFKDQARDDIGDCVKNHSELTEEAAAILPTDLWVEINQLNSFMAGFLVSYDENKDLDENIMTKLHAIHAKVALLSRAVLGVDELTEESIKLFLNSKYFERLAKLESKKLEVLAKRKNA